MRNDSTRGYVFTLIGLVAVLLVWEPAVQAREPAGEGRSFSQAMTELAEDLTGQLSGTGNAAPVRVTIEGFAHLDGSRSALSQYVAEELLTALVQTRLARVQARGHTPEALAASEWAQDLDPDQVEQLQRQLGADYVVVGSIADLGTTFNVHARLIEVGSRRIPAAARVLVAKDSILGELASRPLSGMSGRPPQETPTRNPGRTHTAEGLMSQEFQAMRIEVTRVMVGRDRITMLLEYLNKTDQELVIGLVAPGPNYQQGMRTFLIDGAGNQFTYTGGSGLAEGWGFAIRNWAPGTSWLRVPPGGSASASLTFQEVTKTGGMFVWTNVADQIEVEPDATLTLVSEQAYVEREQPERRFTVRIVGIQAGNDGASASSK